MFFCIPAESAILAGLSCGVMGVNGLILAEEYHFVWIWSFFSTKTLINIREFGAELTFT